MNLRPPVLKALLVGINKYPNPAHRLRGCINDLKAMQAFLEMHCGGEKVQIELKTLENKAATRSQVIDTFLEHFNTLKDGDLALFYFSGHGSQMPAPPEFWHNTPNHQLETFVCYDSRLKEGRDIADKELSYLLWQVTKGKQVSFTVIFDCCHSGDITRTQEANTRRTASSKQMTTWKDFFGAEDYHEKDGKVTVPKGRHLLLSACRNDEVAKEKYLESNFRGVFTYSLLKALTASNGKLTCQTLAQRTQVNVYNQTNAQHPQFQTTHFEDENTLFLGGVLKDKPSNHLLFYNHQTQDTLPTEWLINVGQIHGLEASKGGKLWVFENESTPSKEKHFENAVAEITLEEVLPTHTIVKVPEQLLKNQTYQAIFVEMPISLLKVAIHPESEAEGVILLQREFEAATSHYLDLVENWQNARYLIHAANKQLWVRTLGETELALQRINGYSTVSINQLVQNLEIIAQWHRIKGLSNSFLRLNLEQIELEFYEVLETSSNFMLAEQEQLIPDFLTKEPILKYQFDPKKEDPRYLAIDPAFRLKIKNPSSARRRLWFSTLYLGSDFSIKNDLMPMQPLDPGEEKWLEFFDEKYEMFTTVIPLHMEDAYLDWGIRAITEHFKILVCTHEFDTRSWNQEGIPLGGKPVENGRGFGRKRRIDGVSKMDWGSIDFGVRVEY